MFMRMVAYLIVNKQKEIEFINDCEAIFDKKELQSAILWYQAKPTSRLKHVYLHGSYPAVSIHKEKIHIHRLLMSYWLGIKIPKDFTVHHLDHNKLNALKDNLSVMFSSKHQSYHNKGKCIPEHVRKATIESNKKRKGIKLQPYRQDVGINKIIELKNQGMSINKISKVLGCDWTTIRQRIHDNSELLRGE